VRNQTRKLRVGIVGAGGIVRQRHLPGLQALPQVEVVAVCNSSKESARQVAKDFHIPDVMDDWAELIDRPDLDIIWVGTPPVLHAPITISALEAGKHVFCQGRMAMNIAEAREMLAAAQARPQQVTMLCPPPHGMRGDLFLQKLLREGYAGELWHFKLSALNGQFSDPLAPAHWRQRTELSGHNVLTAGIYAEVIERWLGSPRRLHAQMKVSVPKRGNYVVHVPDVVQVFGQWANGLAGSLEWSGVAQFAPDETLAIYGRDGTLVYNFTQDKIFGARRGESGFKELVVPTELERTWTVERDFVQAVIQGGFPEPSFETGVKYMEFTDAIHRSARGGHAVELPLS
jgi:predicted dehydrogenase